MSVSGEKTRGRSAFSTPFAPRGRPSCVLRRGRAVRSWTIAPAVAEAPAKFRDICLPLPMRAPCRDSVPEEHHRYPEGDPNAARPRRRPPRVGGTEPAALGESSRREPVLPRGEGPMPSPLSCRSRLSSAGPTQSESRLALRFPEPAPSRPAWSTSGRTCDPPAVRCSRTRWALARCSS